MMFSFLRVKWLSAPAFAITLSHPLISDDDIVAEDSGWGGLLEADSSLVQDKLLNLMLEEENTEAAIESAERIGCERHCFGAGRESGTKSRQTLNTRYDLKITGVKVG
ncbi:hypothetical protein HAX54_040523 [Datura stramonium]|uniref:Uncharacterized protein n=1 Tax=Datura stramonium TaxID=4076 RepID=A0ABS8VRG6_DATST|nr:hypothetical protein [Datura stramonium]